ncbi:TPA: hypothetical protein ACYHS5_003728 [Vibrio cholerae]|uniref:hypothetical protein n=1 Tax=Vibrio cholerae TaxID=666 RepID=UPI0011D94FE0|nr:hypothetical protein [Vibrio cholerae]EGR4159104.1 hypothetical protein [Vibrio cholerae]EJL6485273.1 hypothetical protein [Vibrio cholerae]EJL6560396.1 hypothetical protein [Vibrio cholerae]ELB7342486.1 hypothetical protein [Vibrio cholerae]ELC9568270.1 hypothetical protein [Vibrio cholerae]
MTLIAAWVRHHNKAKELYVASDSRLNGGQTWDIGTKVLDLGRGDAVIAFAGRTANAYPLMLQLQTAVKMHTKLRTRAYDLTELKGHVLRIFNDMWQKISDLPHGQKKPDPAETSFILAGYSWKISDFKIWTVYFDETNNEFKFSTASKHRKRGGGNKYFAFIGDDANLANNRVYEILRERDRVSSVGMIMEPFEVLLDFIRDSSKPYIGGAPQMYKIYAHMNTMPYNVYWPNDGSGTIAFGGRVLMPYERNEYLAFNPDTFEVSETNWPDATGR